MNNNPPNDDENDSVNDGTCDHPKRTKVEDSIVCSLCGLVLGNEALTFVEEPHHLNSGSQQIVGETISKSLLELSKSLANKFGISETIRAQAYALLEAVLTKEVSEINQGKSGKVFLGAALYLLGRGDSLSSPSTSIRDIGEALEATPAQLLRAIRLASAAIRKRNSVLGADKDLLPLSLGPKLYIERLAQQAICLTYPGTDTREIERTAVQICDFCSAWGLVEGRKPQPIALAAILLAFESAEPKKGKTTAPWIRSTSELTDLSPSTVSERISEIKEYLIKEVQNIDDIGVVKKDKVVLYLDSILRHELFRKNDIKAPPPSSIASGEYRTRQEELVKLANTRIQSAPKYQDNDSTDIGPRNGSQLEILVMERLLLHGVSEERLLQVTGLDELLSMELEYCSEYRLLSDSSDL